jgi:hypothetical protein
MRRKVSLQPRRSGERLAAPHFGAIFIRSFNVCAKVVRRRVRVLCVRLQVLGFVKFLVTSFF